MPCELCEKQNGEIYDPILRAWIMCNHKKMPPLTTRELKAVVPGTGFDPVTSLL